MEDDKKFEKLLKFKIYIWTLQYFIVCRPSRMIVFSACVLSVIYGALCRSWNITTNCLLLVFGITFLLKLFLSLFPSERRESKRQSEIEKMGFESYIKSKIQKWMEKRSSR